MCIIAFVLYIICLVYYHSESFKSVVIQKSPILSSRYILKQYFIFVFLSFRARLLRLVENFLLAESYTRYIYIYIYCIILRIQNMYIYIYILYYLTTKFTLSFNDFLQELIYLLIFIIFFICTFLLVFYFATFIVDFVTLRYIAFLL